MTGESIRGTSDFMKYPACRGAPAPDMPDDPITVAAAADITTAATAITAKA
jgi:hypothetical protein